MASTAGTRANPRTNSCRIYFTSWNLIGCPRFVNATEISIRYKPSCASLLRQVGCVWYGGTGGMAKTGAGIAGTQAGIRELNGRREASFSTKKDRNQRSNFRSRGMSKCRRSRAAADSATTAAVLGIKIKENTR